MKTIDRFEFPETVGESRSWKPVTRRKALHSQVLCHARTRIEGMWAAYIFPVPGMNHEEEEWLWKTEGNKLPEDIARAIFPAFRELPYAK